MSSPATRQQSPVTHSDDEVLVRVDGVSKKFCRSLKKSLWYGVCDIAGELLPGRKRRETRDEGRELSDRSAQDISRSPLDTGLSTAAASALASGPSPLDSSCSDKALDSGPSTLDSSSGLRAGEFFAVKDVSFELRRGECLGLIGHNGAGKTTLLKMLNGLIKPDRGTITMRGRVGALIALGAGFNPILTGRENIYINGSVLGLTKKEIDAKIDEIIDFAEIREFIDMPVQSYSSGMSVRLGFAVATALDPDVLILDEVLAVGDAAFRNKCYNKITKIIKKCCVIFVSHSMDQIREISDKGLLLEKGQIEYLGEIEGAVQLYEEKAFGFLSSNSETVHQLDGKFLWDNEKIKIDYNKPFRIPVKIKFDNPPKKGFIRFLFKLASGSVIAEFKTGELNFDCLSKFEKSFEIESLKLKNGIYILEALLHSNQNIGAIAWSRDEVRCLVQGSPKGFAPYILQ
jgi:lipopolysaccharide transport system ATP-binding protein